MRTKKDAIEIIKRLKTLYPLAQCSLEFSDAWQLMVAVRLSAQCTDLRVNVVVAKLFAKYPTLIELANATAQEIENIVKPCGLGKSKARDIHGAANMVIDKFGGEIPCDMDSLLSLPGVGRKSANLIRGDIFNLPAVVADTHCIRIANRIGFIDNINPAKVEAALWKVLPLDETSDYCHRCVIHGRAVCTARKAFCELCTLNDICKTGIQTIKASI